MRLLTALFLASLAAAQPVPPEQCFPVESLPPAEQPQAAALFLQLMDSEALYTVIGGVKPMSGGFTMFRLPADSLDPEKIDTARRHLAVFRCGTQLLSTVHHFARLFPDRDSKTMERAFEAVVFHAAGLTRTITAHKDFFYPLGISAHTHPLETLLAIEYQEPPARFRGLGHLFGYPDYAVDFFVSASRQQSLTGTFVARDFIGMPTFARADRGVVYAVEKGATEREVDQQLRTRLATILEDYRKRRERFIGEGKPGIIALLRDWFCQGNQCSVP